MNLGKLITHTAEPPKTNLAKQMAMVTTPGMLLDILDVLEILSDFGLVRRTAFEYLRLPLMVPAKDAASVAMVGG